MLKEKGLKWCMPRKKVSKSLDAHSVKKSIYLSLHSILTTSRNIQNIKSPQKTAQNKTKIYRSKK
jgi:hypothetical protein